MVEIESHHHQSDAFLIVNSGVWEVFNDSTSRVVGAITPFRQTIFGINGQ